MKLLLGTVGTSKVDMNNAIDFLSTVQRKERSASYRQSDYLGLKRRKIVPTHRDDERVRSACSYYQKVGHWEISIEGRIQVGQWFYKSKLIKDDACITYHNRTNIAHTNFHQTPHQPTPQWPRASTFPIILPWLPWIISIGSCLEQTLYQTQRQKFNC